MVLIDLLKQSCQKASICKQTKKQYLKYNKVKNNKTEYVCVNFVPLDKLLLIALFPYLVKHC